jgi:hypothetical protein
MNGWVDDVIDGIAYGLASMWGDNDSSRRRSRQRRRLRDRLRRRARR